ncbi:MAG: ABC transporter permease [Burkholderiaceae bacterium]
MNASTTANSRLDRAALRRFCVLFSGSRPAAFAAMVLVMVVVVAVLAPWISPQNPYDLAALNLDDSRQPPFSRASDGHLIYWLGTDGQGRDVLSALLYGLRISVGVGVLATLVALLLGTSLGLVAGYRRGLWDTLIMRWADIQLAFPSILLALILLAFLRPGIANIIIALVAVQWAYYARAARGMAVVERNKEYVEAGIGLGLSTRRVIFAHLLPNCLGPLIVIAALQVASAITLEATLSFFGLGVPITQPSLGLLIANGFEYLLSGTYWISVFPGLALLITIVAINLVSDRLRDLLNPRRPIN